MSSREAMRNLPRKRCKMSLMRFGKVAGALVRPKGIT